MILRLVKTVPQRLDAILADSVVCAAASRISRRRAGASAAGTIQERLQALGRRADRLILRSLFVDGRRIGEPLNRLDC